MSTTPATIAGASTNASEWQQRLEHVIETVRTMSLHQDPEEMVRTYARRMREVFPLDGHLSLSRRGLTAPRVRITRNSAWKEHVNPWKQKDRLPVLEGGILAEWIYGNEPRLIDHLDVSPDDPAFEYLREFKSALVIPHFDGGEALNMVAHLRKQPAAFDREQFPELVLTSNLFGRATRNLVLSEELGAAYQSIDHELKLVGDIQRSLLPPGLPDIPGMRLAVHYQTSKRAGGDYYDFFPLAHGEWGILIADVSGHGTPAAVVMAITHTIAHTLPGPPTPPGRLLGKINELLCGRYTQGNGTFVTAFYGVYDPTRRRLTYGSAGHNPPRLRRADGTMQPLDGARHLPLGIDPEEPYTETSIDLSSGDLLLLYTDGVTETFDADGTMFGARRLDDVLGRPHRDPTDAIDDVMESLHAFAGGKPPTDDRTLLAATME
ncbi:MAG: PP2C family protein-serine/threonine phosphatase [Tepidisphaeraceae bacterium]